MTTGFASIEAKAQNLIRKGLTGSVFFAPITSTAITVSNLFDAVTGQLVALPTGYVDMGYLTTAGAKLSHAVKTSEIDSWGSNYPTRTDVTQNVATLVVESQETKLATVGLFTGQNTSSVTAAANGSFSIQPPANPSTTFYRVLMVSVDTSSLGEFVIARFFPNASITNLNDQVFANADAPTTWGVTFTAYVDQTLGYPEDYIIGGSMALALATAMSVPRSLVLTTTSASPNVTATTGTFFASDVGHVITGAGITAGTKVLTFTDSTHVVLNANATATATLVPATIV